MTTLKVNMNNPGYNQENSWSYDCSKVNEIEVTYDGGLQDNFTSVSYSGSTVTVTLCGLFKFNFTNINDPTKIIFKVKKADDAAFDPGMLQYSNLLNKFLKEYTGINYTGERAAGTIDIDMNYPAYNTNLYTYNCAGITNINATYDSEIEPGPNNNFTSVTLSGSTLAIKVCNLVTYKFTNIANLEDITLKVIRSAGALNPGDEQFYGSLKEFCDTYVDWTPTKGTAVKGSDLDDTIVFNSYTGTRGLNINAGKGDDDVTGTQYNDTITGGVGRNTINLSIAGFGNDSAVLTKNENLVINIPDTRGDGINPESDTMDKYYKYEMADNRKDLVVTVYKDKVDGTMHTADITKVAGILTIKNYAVKDVVGANGSITIKAGDLAGVDVINTVSLTTKLYKDDYNPNDKTQIKKATFAGTWVNDNIDATNYRDSVAEGKITDVTKIDAIKGVTINAGAGNDTISGSRYADTITGGAGVNTLVYDPDLNFGNDIVNLTKGERLNVNIGSMEAQYEPSEKNKNDLLVILKNGKTIKGTITLKNYLSKDLGATVSINGLNLAEIASLTQVTAENYFEKDGKINAKYVGTALADNVDAYDLSKPTKTVKEIKQGVTIQTGLGDDIIAGSKFNDTITGGVGVNTINLYTSKDFGEDMVVLTKNENLILKVADLNTQDAYLDYTYVHLNGNNLVVDVYDRAIVWDLTDVNKISDDFDGVKRGSVVIKDYTKKDVITNAGSLTLIDNNPDSAPANLRRFTNEVNLTTSSKFTGTWIDDEVYATEYVVKKNNSAITSETAGYEKVKGVNINLGGSVYGNVAEGSIYADLIVGGANVDRIWGGKGNDSILGGAGDDILRGQEGNDTLLGGDGNDTIEGGFGDDVLNGGNGDDILDGGTGSDKLTGGKGADTFKFALANNSNTDTILDALNEDKIAITNLNSNKIEYIKNGNHLEITGVDEDITDKIIVQNYFAKKEAQRIDELQAADVTVKISEQTFTVKGKGAINGTTGADKVIGSDYADTIKTLAGDDTISAGAGNDNIWGGLGDDSINAGVGKNNIYFNLGDGDDTIVAVADAHDTIVFENGTKIGAVVDGDDLLITYSGTKNKVHYENTIMVQGYSTNKSVEKIKIGNVTKTVQSYLNGGGGGGGGGAANEYISTEKGEYWAPYYTSEYGAGAKITAGNHKFIYDDANVQENEYTVFGQDIIDSPNVTTTTYTETFEFHNNSVQSGGHIYAGSDDITFMMYGRSGYIPDAIIHYFNVLENTDISKPTIAVKDKDRTYDLKAYRNTGDTNINNNTGGAVAKNNITLVTADKDTHHTTTVTSNNKYNYTNLHRTAVNYTYNGGYDKLETDEYAYTNDTYNISSFSTNTHLRILEGGGTADVINFNYENASADDIRLIFDVTQFGDNLLGTRDNIRTFYVHKDALADDTAALEKILASDDQAPCAVGTIDGSIFVTDLPQVQEYPSGIETIMINGVAINKDAWYDAVQSRLGQIVRYEEYHNDIGYTSVTSALTWDEHPISEEQKANIINAYRTLKYSDIVQQTVDEENQDINFAQKFNRYTFSGSYNGATITSANTKWNGYADTLIFTDSKFADGTLSMKIAVDELDDTKKNLVITSNNKTVTYKNYLTGNNGDLILIDQDGRKVSVTECSTKDTMPKGESFDFGNNGNEGTYNAVFVNNDGSDLSNEDVSFCAHGKSKNYIYTEGGVNLEYSQYDDTCHSTVVTASASDDKYQGDETTHLMIEEHGGDDRITFGSYYEQYNYDNLGIVFNVTDDSYMELGQLVKVYNGYRNHAVFTDKEHITKDTLIAVTTDHLVDTVGVNILDKSTDAANTGGIEHIGSWYSDPTNANAWYNGITEAVGNWLHANNYHDVQAVLTAENNDADIASLIEVFQNVNYSQLV